MSSSDPFITEFIKNRCRVDLAQKDDLSNLHEEFVNFMTKYYPSIINVFGKKDFGQELIKRSFAKKRNNRGMYFQGICLVENYVDPKPPRRILNKSLLDDDQFERVETMRKS